MLVPALLTEIDERLERRRAGDVVGLLCCSLEGRGRTRRGAGHEAELAVLDAVERALRGCARAEDLVARLDDGRILILTSAVMTERDLESLAARVVDGVKAAPAAASGVPARSSLSIGIASTLLADGSRSLLDASELARAAAVEEVRRPWAIYHHGLRDRAVAELRADEDLVRAVAEGQMEVHYQPVFRAGGGAVEHLEALLRWRHPVRQLILPGAFLDAARRLGLLHAIGAGLFDIACRRCAAWSEDLRRPLVVSVNVDRDQLLGPELASMVGAALNAASLAADQLRVEVRMGSLADERVLATLASVAALGVGIVIDDLQPHPDDIEAAAGLAGLVGVKLDSSAVRGIGTEPWSTMFATAVSAVRGIDAGGVDTGRRRRVEVVAQGLEDRSQVDAALAAGVDGLQGFALGRPMAPERLGPMLMAGNGPYQLSGADVEDDVEDDADASLPR